MMKKARQAPANEYWDKKLLEAEEKDPNRWKHSGYKRMYVNGVRKSRSRSPMRKTPVSPRARHVPQSPVRRRMSRTPERYKQARYPREMVKPKEMYRGPVKSRPISPPPKVNFHIASSPRFALKISPTGRSNPVDLKLLRRLVLRLQQRRWQTRRGQVEDAGTLSRADEPHATRQPRSGASANEEEQIEGDFAEATSLEASGFAGEGAPTRPGACCAVQEEGQS